MFSKTPLGEGGRDGDGVPIECHDPMLSGVVKGPPRDVCHGAARRLQIECAGSRASLREALKPQCPGCVRSGLWLTFAVWLTFGCVLTARAPWGA